jgi:hypothetical protein
MGSPKRLDSKDPTEVVPYGINWNLGENGAPGLLGADTITGLPTWTVQTGITKDSQSNDATTTTVILSGGTAGTDYTLTCLIDTALGYKHERSIIVPVVDSTT